MLIIPLYDNLKPRQKWCTPLSVTVTVSASLSVTAQSLNKVDLQKQVSCMIPSYDLRLWFKIGGNAWVGSIRGWNQATSHSETSPEPKFYFDTRTAQTQITCVGSAVLNCNASSNSIMAPSFGCSLCSSFQRFMSAAKSLWAVITCISSFHSFLYSAATVLPIGFFYSFCQHFPVSVLIWPFPLWQLCY